MKKLYVRNTDKMIFPIDRETLEPLRCSNYEPYCFSDPDTDREYMEFGDWLLRKAQEK